MWRDWDSSNLPGDWTMALFVVEKWVGEVHHVFMAVDVGHSVRSRGRDEGAGEYRQKTMETSKVKPQDYIYPRPVFNQVTYLQRISSGPLSVHQTLCPDGSL